MREDILEEIGLTKSEIKVYLALLELGSSATGKIVEKSKASSSKIYEILDKLMQKGLVSFIVKGGVKYFEAAPPERIMDYLKEKEEQFSKQKEEMKNLLPELELKQKLAQYKSEATIFKGIKGGETAFRYMMSRMKKDDEWVGFVVSFSNQKYFDLLTKLHEWRAKKGLRSRIIIAEKYSEEGLKREKLPLTKVKYVPDELQTPAIINVAGDIALLNIMAEEMTVFMIENKDVADSFKNQFEKMWDQKTYIYQGYDEFKRIWLETLQMGDTLYFIGAKGYFFDSKPNDAMEVVEAARKKGMRWKNIVDEDTRGHMITKLDIAETRYVKEKITAPGVIWVCGNRTIISNWAKGEPIMLAIDNKEIADSYRNYFEILWGMAEP